MEYRTLGGSGLKIPALILGTATFGGGNEFLRKWGATDVQDRSTRTGTNDERGHF
jgi:aryl-alcohol dehydrogenase-like predicted oxidoreductase